MNQINNDALRHLQVLLTANDALLIEDPIDLFYILKKPISTGSLLIEKTSVSLFIDGRYFSAFHNCPGLKAYISENNGFFTYLKSSQIKTIYFDPEKTTFQKASKLKTHPSCIFEPKTSPLIKERLIKTEGEILQIRKNAHLLANIYIEFLKKPKIGLTEKQIATQFKILSLEMGAEGFSFEPIIATGLNTAFPHHRPTDRTLHHDECMLVDVGVTKDSYQSDMTRMVFIGNVSDQMLLYHDYVLEAHQAALALCRPGIKVQELDLAARSVFKKYNVENLFCHSLGHGLGLETHESPRLKFDGPDKDLILEEGMVITIEPGLYKEGLGGIRHEDLIVITKDSYENFYPKYF